MPLSHLELAKMEEPPAMVDCYDLHPLDGPTIDNAIVTVENLSNLGLVDLWNDAPGIWEGDHAVDDSEQGL
jgi:hypothetical protein